MMRTLHPISLASGVLPEFGPNEIVEAALAGGFDAVGLWIELAEWSDATTREVKARLMDAALPLLDVEVIWIQPGALDSDHLRILDIGGELGAKNALVVSSDPDHHATAEKFSTLCAHGGEQGMRVALEFGIFTEVKTIQQALKIIENTNNSAAALLIDPIHLSRSGGTPLDLVSVPSAMLAYAQLCDAVEKKPDAHDIEAVIRDAVDERMQVGEGALPLLDILAHLPPTLPLSIELRSKALRAIYPEHKDRAVAVAKVTRRFLDNVQ